MFSTLLPRPRDLACHSQLSWSSSSQYYCVESLCPSAGFQPPLPTCCFSQGALLYLLHTAPLSRDSSLKTSFKLLLETPVHFCLWVVGSTCALTCGREQHPLISWYSSVCLCLWAGFCLASLENDYFHCICVPRSTEEVLCWALKRSCADLGLQSLLNADSNDGITANCPLDSLRVALCPCHESGREGWLWAQGCAAGGKAMQMHHTSWNTHFDSILAVPCVTCPGFAVWCRTGKWDLFSLGVFVLNVFK